MAQSVQKKIGILPAIEAEAYRKLSVSWHEPARQAVRTLSGTQAYERSRRARYKIEALFAELKQRMRLGRVRLRRLWCIRATPVGRNGAEPETAGAIPRATTKGAGTERRLNNITLKGERRKRQIERKSR